MPDHHERQPNRRGARALVWLERLLLLAGAVTLVCCAVIVADAVIAQRSARRALETATLVEQPLLAPAFEEDIDVLPRDPAVHVGSAIAALSIPRVALSAVVLHGSDAQTLRRGPGHLENTAFPGRPGNVVIAGHRDSFFWPLRNIQRGDDIFLDTLQGQFHYQVTSVRVVNPRDVSVLAQTDETMLTLITCYPFWVFGNAPDRFVVRAAIVDAAVRQETIAGASTGTAVVEESVVRRSADPELGDISDDEVLVRLAVERYRLTYNGRLISHHEVGPAGLLRFQTCDIAVAGDGATAICDAGPQSLSDPEPHGRSFTLERAAGGWAIKSIVVK